MIKMTKMIKKVSTPYSYVTLRLAQAFGKFALFTSFENRKPIQVPPSTLTFYVLRFTHHVLRITIRIRSKNSLNIMAVAPQTL
jgi:hypothetical protein